MGTYFRLRFLISIINHIHFYIILSEREGFEQHNRRLYFYFACDFAEESKVMPKLTFWSLFKFCVLVINQSISSTLSCWILFHYVLLHSHAKFQMEKIIFSLFFCDLC